MGDNKKINQFSKIGNLNRNDLFLVWDNSAGNTLYTTLDQISQFTSGDIDTDNWFEEIFVTVSGHFENQETSGNAFFDGDTNVAKLIGGNYAGHTLGGSDAGIGAGNSNTADGPNTFVCGGSSNNAQGSRSIIAGGTRNDDPNSNNEDNFIGAGRDNSTEQSKTSAIIGGTDNSVDANWAGIYVGRNNTNSGDYSAIAAGRDGEIGDTADYSFIGGGQNQKVLGDHAGITYGEDNLATKTYSFAAGNRAKTQSFGAAVWKDGTDVDVQDSGINTLVLSFSGGVHIEGGLFVDGQEVSGSESDRQNAQSTSTSLSIDQTYGAGTLNINTPNNWFELTSLDISIPKNSTALLIPLLSCHPPSNTSDQEISGRVLTGDGNTFVEFSESVRTFTNRGNNSPNILDTNQFMLRQKIITGGSNVTGRVEVRAGTVDPASTSSQQNQINLNESSIDYIA